MCRPLHATRTVGRNAAWLLTIGRVAQPKLPIAVEPPREELAVKRAAVWYWPHAMLDTCSGGVRRARTTKVRPPSSAAETVMGTLASSSARPSKAVEASSRGCEAWPAAAESEAVTARVTDVDVDGAGGAGGAEAGCSAGDGASRFSSRALHAVELTASASPHEDVAVRRALRSETPAPPPRGELRGGRRLQRPGHTLRVRSARKELPFLATSHRTPRVVARRRGIVSSSVHPAAMACTVAASSPSQIPTSVGVGTRARPQARARRSPVTQHVWSKPHATSSAPPCARSEDTRNGSSSSRNAALPRAPCPP